MTLQGTIRWVYRCDMCGQEVTQEHETLPKMEKFMPGVPQGWIEVNSNHYCEKHTLQIVEKIS